MSTVDDIKARLDIVATVSDYVSLQKAGRNLKAVCPFHTEKTPSFIISPERQSWRCFGACATGGDIFTFVMKADRVEFSEALKILAQKAGITLTDRRENSQDGNLYQINQEAAIFFQKILHSEDGKDAIGYLTERGVNFDAISTFKLGLSPKGNDGLKTHLTSLGFNLDQALKAGLLRRTDDNQIRDFFWGRLMFPILDTKKQVAGFGARSLDGSDPKYINTPATPIFDKRSMLYGLHNALDAIRTDNTVVVVEGYMDTIATHQYGYTNVVASMGTALTELQVSRLKSVAKNFILALDPDLAGQEATLRSLESSWNVFERQKIHYVAGDNLYRTTQLNLKIAELPDKLDPDTLIRSNPTEWERLIQQAIPFTEYLITAISAKYDTSTAQGKAQAADTLVPLIASKGNAVEQEHHLSMLSNVLGVSREALQASIGKPKPNTPYRQRYGKDINPTKAASISPLEDNRQDFLENYVLALVLNHPELKKKTPTLTEEYFHRTDNREIFTSWLDCTTMEELQESIDDTLYERLVYLKEMEIKPINQASAGSALTQSVNRLEQRHLQSLQDSLLEASDTTLPPPTELRDSIVKINSRLKELFSERNY